MASVAFVGRIIWFTTTRLGFARTYRTPARVPGEVVLAGGQPAGWDASVMTDISGWVPDWGSAATQLASHGPRLRSLRGRRVVQTWIVWILDSDCWFADLPVVVVFDDGSQLEVCWQKFDELSISWNTIDVNVTPRCGGPGPWRGAWMLSLLWARSLVRRSHPWLALSTCSPPGRSTRNRSGT